MARPQNIVEAFDGPFAVWRGDPDGWSAWRVFLKAFAAVPLEDGEAELFRRCTGRQASPLEPVTEAWVIVGRRGRKSATAAMIGVYQAIYPDWSPFIAPGEVARVLIVAVSKDQASLVRSYAEAILRSRPGLARQIVACDAESITLKNGIEVKCVANSYRSIRGPTVVCAILDELAYWRDETSAVPDVEVMRAIKPSMITVRGAVLIGLSSPHAKRGLLYQKHRAHFGRDGKVLVWAADSVTMNPAIEVAEVEAAWRDDPVAAASEHGVPGGGIKFREDLQAFLDMDLLASLARSSPLELPPLSGVRHEGFVDPSGGRGDSFALAIAHRREGGKPPLYVVDVVRSVAAPFDPAVVVKDMVKLLREYGIRRIIGDAYSGEWVRQAFEAEGVTYKVSGRSKSEVYLEALPLFTRGEVELPDSRPLLVELASLERRTARGGRDSVDHPRGAHDDKANVTCGVLVELAGRRVESWGPDAVIMGPRPAVVREFGQPMPMAAWLQDGRSPW
jgi:hypothetical protein